MGGCLWGMLLFHGLAGRWGSSWSRQWPGSDSSIGVWLASRHSIPELSSTSSRNMMSSSHQGLLRCALQVCREAGGHTHYMLCSSHQGGLSCRGVGR